MTVMIREYIIPAALLVALAVVVGVTMFPAETAGKRLRRECTSIIKEAYGPNPYKKYSWEGEGPNVFDQFQPPLEKEETARLKSLADWEEAMEDRVQRCIIARGHAGR